MHFGLRVLKTTRRYAAKQKRLDYWRKIIFAEFNILCTFVFPLYVNNILGIIFLYFGGKSVPHLADILENEVAKTVIELKKVHGLKEWNIIENAKNSDWLALLFEIMLKNCLALNFLKLKCNQMCPKLIWIEKNR